METMSPEKAMELLNKYGTNVTAEEAKLIIDFLKKLAEISIRTYQNAENKMENNFE